MTMTRCSLTALRHFVGLLFFFFCWSNTFASCLVAREERRASHTHTQSLSNNAARIACQRIVRPHHSVVGRADGRLLAHDSVQRPRSTLRAALRRAPHAHSPLAVAQLWHSWRLTLTHSASSALSPPCALAHRSLCQRVLCIFSLLSLLLACLFSSLVARGFDCVGAVCGRCNGTHAPSGTCSK